MNIEYKKEDKLLILQITEEIDHHTTKEIRRKSDYEIQRYMPKKALFDFNSVVFMDSAGIGMLIGRYKTMMHINGSLGIINVNPSIKKILEMSGILKIIPIEELTISA